jgi:hypothetical protein
MLIKLSACGACRGVWKLLRAGRSVATALSCLFLAAGLGLMPIEAHAAPGVKVVQSDMGGDVGARANQIEAMRRNGQSVEIRGAACYSACTMYLSLPNSCVSRNTRFGFHRPSFYGAALAPDKFEFWSRVIAAHYPAPLQSWYMSDGRYSVAPRLISGAEIIRMGVPECT